MGGPFAGLRFAATPLTAGPTNTDVAPSAKRARVIGNIERVANLFLTKTATAGRSTH
ncbi:hypothetical protein MBOT_36370 [Mycobacterium botniense]|uniref:Uncharacterized protein n=2 Tax=Mycobacterium botniense TaxID=84962 RepID=A0A7I9Y2G4_9MYCO|nr:hypothetical protein MBOT_36370 [Mycobacterium botniense]